MNLTKLFEMQRVLDERIVKEKGLEDQDLLPQKILALQVELGECANEWRGFKYWSKDQDPRYTKTSIAFADPGGPFEYTTHPLLEEYIDCLHFILSIGNEIGYYYEDDVRYFHEHNIKAYQSSDGLVAKFNEVFAAIHEFSSENVNPEDSFELYEEVGIHFLSLGLQLSFTWEQIEAAYMSKNETNHKRQDTGY